MATSQCHADVTAESVEDLWESRKKLLQEKAHLVHENEELRIENEQLRARVELFTHETSGGKESNLLSQPFWFMDLHKEIRLEIYEYLLVPGVITLRHSDGVYDEDERYAELENTPIYAETQLFLVSKQVKDGSLPLYLSRNLFIVPPGRQSWICAQALYDSPNHVIYGSTSAQLFRRLSIAFDLRDCNLQTMAVQSIGAMTAPDTAYWPRLSFTERMMAIHSSAEDDLISHHWCLLGETIALHLRLNFLQLNFENSYCPFGCCDLRGHAVKRLTEVDWAYSPKLIEILGVTELNDILCVQNELVGKVAKYGTELRFKRCNRIIHKVKVLLGDEILIQDPLFEIHVCEREQVEKVQ